MAFSLFSGSSRADENGKVRPACVAGAFYPGNPDALRREIEGYLSRVSEAPPDARIVAAVAPHAGYRYSAQVAAHVHKAIAGTPFDTIVIIGHDAHARGIVAILSDVTAFETPLGRVPVDASMVARLVQADKGIIIHNRAHERDHTIEVHLPFLQVTHKDFRVVPVMFGDPTAANCRIFADALSEAAEGKNIFVLASTDLSHYPTYTDACRLDGKTIEALESFDLDALLKHLHEAVGDSAYANVETAMCASGGVGTAMLFAKARGANAIRRLAYANSGDVPGGDRSRVVGYVAALMLAPSETAAAPAPAPVPARENTGFSLSEAVQKELLSLARRRIRADLDKRSLDYLPPQELQVELNQPAPVFVTLQKKGRLRGCIGMTSPRGELWRAVYEMAHAAAFEDYRFSPVTRSELDDLHIEISVLSPLRKVASGDEIVPHEHGVVVQRSGRRGLFLPQVWEHFDDKDGFMGELCAQKAHLPRDAWKDPATELFVFTVFAFEEPK